MNEENALRTQELLGACVKLEQVGDIIVRNLLVNVRKKTRPWTQLSRRKAGASCGPCTPALLSNARLALQRSGQPRPRDRAPARHGEGPIPRHGARDQHAAISSACGRGRFAASRHPRCTSTRSAILNRSTRCWHRSPIPFSRKRELLRGSRLRAKIARTASFLAALRLLYWPRLEHWAMQVCNQKSSFPSPAPPCRFPNPPSCA